MIFLGCLKFVGTGGFWVTQILEQVEGLNWGVCADPHCLALPQPPGTCYPPNQVQGEGIATSPWGWMWGFSPVCIFHFAPLHLPESDHINLLQDFHPTHVLGKDLSKLFTPQMMFCEVLKHLRSKGKGDHAGTQFSWSIQGL